MENAEYTTTMMKKLLQKSAENTQLLISRVKGRSIYASNGHWIVTLGEPAMPILYRQAYAESVPVGKQGRWWIDFDDNGDRRDEQFELHDIQSVKTLWDEVRAIGGRDGKITTEISNAFGGTEIYRRLQFGSQNLWVDEEYLIQLYDVAKLLVAQPTAKSSEEPTPRISIWAEAAMVAILMPVKEPIGDRGG